MIVINGKEYRNLEEQVQKNQEDIAALQTQDVTKEYVDTQIGYVQTSITALDHDVEDLSRSVSDKIDTEDGKAQGTFIVEPKPHETTSQLLINDEAGTGIQIVQDSNGASVDYDGTGIIEASKSFMDKFQADTSYAPGNDMNVATKKYVDEAVAGAGGGDVTKAYVDEKDAALQDNIDKKVSQMDSTSGSYAYVRNGSRDDKIAVNSLVGSGAIVRRTSTGQIKANDAIEDKDTTTLGQINTLLAAKQNILTAGTGISIVDNVISLDVDDANTTKY